MSANTIARWNAIPLERSNDENTTSTSQKRGRPDDDDDDDDDDDISIVSRSPSPLPHDAMDVDGSHLHKYDEYIRGPAREVITVETKIKPSNKGFALLSKFGWVEGQPIGLSGEGRTEPIPFHIKSDLTGLGKTSQDVRMIEETVSQRRELDSERQQKESDEQRKLREDTVARKSALESEISSTLRAFYCTLCDKQFKNVAQYDEHTNSYAHHHKARFKDMQANIRLKPKEEVDKRKEKERKREEKELRKIAAANGIKMPKPTAIPNPTTLAASSTINNNNNNNANTSENSATSNMDVDGIPLEPRKSNWSSVSSISDVSPSQASTGGGFNRSGWAAVGGPSSNSSRFAAVPAPVPVAPSAHVDPAQNHRASHVPSFRTGGWTSLDTNGSRPPSPYTSVSSSAVGLGSRSGSEYQPSQHVHPPPHPPPPPPPPSEPPSHIHGGWASNSASVPSSTVTSATPGLGSSSGRGGWQTSSFTSVPPPPPPSTVFVPPPPPPQSHPHPPPPPPSSASSSTSPPIPPPAPIQQPPRPPPPAEDKPKPVRSNWQQFQKGRRK